MDKVLVIDNGSGLIKAGFSTSQPPIVLQNAVVKNRRDTYIGDEIKNMQNSFDIQSIASPFIKGLLCNFDLQQTIWDRLFALLPQFDANFTSLIMTEPLLNPFVSRNSYCQSLFEHYNFTSLLLSPCHKFAPFSINDPEFNKNCALVIDSGFSSTTIVPLVKGIPLNYAAKRINVGSQSMTQNLQKLVSFRQIDIKNDFFLAEKIRKKLCYISLDFDNELNTLRVDSLKKTHIALPDGNYLPQPVFFKRPEDLDPTIQSLEPQVVTISNEMISVPEVLFHPSDLRLNQAGIAESVLNSIKRVPSELHAELLGNILITGGNALIRNFKERLLRELKVLAPESSLVRVFAPADAINASWKGAFEFGNVCDRKDLFLTKKDYLEKGEEYCHRWFSFEN